MKNKKDLQTLFSEFINECRYTRRRSPETIRGYEGVFSTFRKLCPIVSVGDITSEKMTQFFKTVQKRKRIVGKGTIKTGVKDSTIATYASKLRAFFEWLVVKGYLDKNPLYHIKYKVPMYDDSKALRKEEIEKLRTAIESHANGLLHLKRDKAMVGTLLFCGLRRGELLGLRVIDVDLQKGTLLVRSETSKSKRSRILPINDPLRLLLEDYLNERKKHQYTTAALFVSLNRDNGLSKEGLKHWVNRLNRLSGVKFHLHQFRHTFATKLGSGNINAIQLQSLLGHTDLRMTQRYVRSITAEDLRSAVDSLSFD